MQTTIHQNAIKLFLWSELDFDVQFPLNYDDAWDLMGPQKRCGSWPKVPYIKNGIAQTYTLNGKIFLDSVPSPDYTRWPQGTLCLKSAVVYTDTKLPRFVKTTH